MIVKYQVSDSDGENVETLLGVSEIIDKGGSHVLLVSNKGSKVTIGRSDIISVDFSDGGWQYPVDSKGWKYYNRNDP